MIRRAEKADLGQIMEILEDAKQFLWEQGIDQWQDGNPNETVIVSDLLENESFVWVEGELLVAYVTLKLSREESYQEIFDGEWISADSSYATIHRAAIRDSYRGSGLSWQLFAQCESVAKAHGRKYIRIDTHKDNIRMRHLCETYGFKYCGSIFLKSSGAPREAYEKQIESKDFL